LIVLNYVVLPRQLPESARPGKISLLAICVSWLCYLALAVIYLVVWVSPKLV